MSKRLTEEAEKYIEDFISNVEDTDISSLDGERSDTNSSLGGVIKLETLQSPVASDPLPVEMDGVALPWLHWEASNDATQSCMRKAEPPVTPNRLLDATQVLFIFLLVAILCWQSGVGVIRSRPAPRLYIYALILPKYATDNSYS